MDPITAAANNDTETVAIILHDITCSEARKGKVGCKQLGWGWWLREANHYIRESRLSAVKLHDEECRAEHKDSSCTFYCDDQPWNTGSKLYWFREANSDEDYDDDEDYDEGEWEG